MADPSTRIRIAGIFLVALAAFGCERDAVEPYPDLPYPEFGERQTSFTDEELAQAVYTDYKYPDSFHTEELVGSLFYVNSLSLDPTDQRWPPLPVCTDSLALAREWSELASRNSSYYRPLVSERVDPKYFEFLRIDPDSSHFLQSRIHRCDYFEPAIVSFFSEPGVFGTFKPRPIDPESVEELGEYLWFIRHYNIGGSAVLSSFIDGAVTGDSILHRIFAADTVFGDFGLHDEITLVEQRLLTNRHTGLVHYDVERGRTVQGRYHPAPTPPSLGCFQIGTSFFNRSISSCAAANAS